MSVRSGGLVSTEGGLCTDVTVKVYDAHGTKVFICGSQCREGSRVIATKCDYPWHRIETIVSTAA